MSINGFYPFWFWNDRLDKQEVRRQIHEMADNGIKGFFIHPRQGLQQPYLSKTFFDMVEVAVNEAEKLKLEVHLYDEYPYPSGVAGGEVVLGNPQFMATEIKHLQYELSSGFHSVSLPEGKVLNCTGFSRRNGSVSWDECSDLKENIGIHLKNDSYNTNGMHNYNGKRYFASEPVPVLEVTLEKPVLLSITVQIIVTNHKYWRYYVDVLNPDAIKEFIQLTHERYYARFADKFGSVIKSIFVDETTPGWSCLIPPAFRKKYNYDLLDKLPALHLENHPEHIKVKRDFAEVKYEMFCEAFEKPVSEWCESHNVLYSGEKPGLRFSQLKFMGIPGCDPGHTKAGQKLDMLKPKIRDNARTVASAAYFYDKSASLCECYHSLGWDATIQDAKVIAEGLLLMGINYLVPHGFFYCTHALKKHDAPPSFFFQMPYWKFWKGLSDRILRISQILEDTYIDANVLVMDPWSGCPDYEQEMCYQTILDTLISNHIEFMIGDLDVLESATIKDSSLKIKDLSINTVIIPPRKWLNKDLQTELEKIRQQGINVLFIDEKTEPCEIRKSFLGITEPSLAFKVTVGNPERLYMVKRSNTSESYWFLLNTASEPVEIEFEDDLSEIPLNDSPDFLRHKKRYIHSFESLLLQTKKKIPPVENFHVMQVDFDDKFTIKLNNKNLYRLYDWDLSIDGGKIYYPVQAVPLSNQLESANIPFPPKITNLFGLKPEITLPELNLLYQYKFNLDFSESLELIMEPESIIGEWTISINNSPIEPDEFYVTDTHIKGSLGVDITGKIREGENTMHIKVKTAQLDGGLLNCLYLAGYFGLETSSKTLKALTGEGAFEDYNANNIPDFSGCVEYTNLFDIKKIPKTDYTYLDFSFMDNFQDSAEISINNSEYINSNWEPRFIKIKTDTLKYKNNELNIKVYSSLIRAFEGE
jgi:hypothetical protein